MQLPPCFSLANLPAVSCSMTPLPAAVLVASSGFHGTDQDEETENGSQLGEGLDSRRHIFAGTSLFGGLRSSAFGLFYRSDV